MRQILVGLSLVVAVGLVACLGAEKGNGGPPTTETECVGQTCAPGLYCISVSPGAVEGSPPYRDRSCRPQSTPAVVTGDAGALDGGDASDASSSGDAATPVECNNGEVACTTPDNKPGCRYVVGNSPPNPSNPYSCVAELPNAAECEASMGSAIYRCVFP